MVCSLLSLFFRLRHTKKRNNLRSSKRKADTLEHADILSGNLSDPESFCENCENIQNEESNLCKFPNSVVFLVITSTNITPETFRCGHVFQ